MDKKILGNVAKLLIGILLIAGVWYLVRCQCVNFETLSPAVMRDYIQGFGPLAPAAYVTAYILNTIAIFPPIGFLTIAGGLAFGKIWGFIYVMTGCIIGTACTFWISRFFGRKLIEKIIKGRFRRLDEKLEKHGFATVAMLRMLYFPYEILNYVSGLSKIKFRDYFFGTFVGLIPGVAISTIFGGAIGSIKKFQDFFTAEFLAAAGLFVAALSIPLIHELYKRRKKGNG